MVKRDVEEQLVPYCVNNYVSVMSYSSLALGLLAGKIGPALAMPLMLALSKMTYMPAKFLEDNGVTQMADKGRIKVGADADITIFDPATVKQVATPADGGLPSEGIPYVVVNGTIVVKDSKVLKGVYPGKPVRLPVQQ